MKSKLTDLAKGFFFPQRAFENLVAAITGLKVVKEYTIFRIPVIGDFCKGQKAAVMMHFKRMSQHGEC